MTGKELAAMQIEQREQLVNGLLLAEGCVLLTADAKAGKSTLALELCRAVVTGTPALEFLNVSQGPALYWMADDGSRERFVRAYQQTFANEPLDNFEAYLERLPLLGGGLDLLRAALKRTAARLTVIDSLTAIRSPRDRNDDFVQNEYDELRLLSDLGREHHCCILVIHHLATGRRATGPNPFIGAAGSFALNGAADGLMTLGLITITRTERIVTAVHRDAPPQRFLYARDQAGKLFYLGGDEWVNCWEDAVQAYRNIESVAFDGAAIGDALGVSDRAGRAKLARWKQAGIVEDIGGRQHAWSEAFLEAVKRLQGGRP
jgi:hypothetical protein